MTWVEGLSKPLILKAPWPLHLPMQNRAGSYNNVEGKRRTLPSFGPLPALGSATLSTDKTIRRVTEPEQQQAETYRYWQSLPIGERLSAVWDVSAAAYAFAGDFKGAPFNDARRPQRTITRV